MPRMGILRNNTKAGSEDSGSKLGRKGMNNVALQTILKKSALAENVSNKQVSYPQILLSYQHLQKIHHFSFNHLIVSVPVQCAS